MNGVIRWVLTKDKNLAGVLEERQSDYKTTLSENEIVEQSLNNPIGSKSLEELAKGKKNIVIISSDHTRPVPLTNYYTYSFKKNS